MQKDAYFIFPARLYIREDDEIVRVCVGLSSNSSVKREVAIEYNTSAGSALGMFNSRSMFSYQHYRKALLLVTLVYQNIFIIYKFRLN